MKPCIDCSQGDCCSCYEHDCPCNLAGHELLPKSALPAAREAYASE